MENMVIVYSLHQAVRVALKQDEENLLLIDIEVTALHARVLFSAVAAISCLFKFVYVSYLCIYCKRAKRHQRNHSSAIRYKKHVRLS